MSPADVESRTLQGVLGELVLDRSGLRHLENTTLDFQKLPDKAILRIVGPLGADFTVKVRAWLSGRRRGRGLVPEGLLVSAGETGGRRRQLDPVHLLPAHRAPLEGDGLLPLFRHLRGR